MQKVVSHFKVFHFDLGESKIDDVVFCFIYASPKTIISALILLVILSYDPPHGPTFDNAKRESDETDLLIPQLK